MVLVPFCTLKKRLGHSITILIISNSMYVQRDEIEMNSKMKPNFRLYFNKTFSRHGKHGKHDKHLLAMPWKSLVEIQTKIRFHFLIHFYFITLYVDFKIIKMPPLLQQFNLHKHSITNLRKAKWQKSCKRPKWFIDVFLIFFILNNTNTYNKEI